MVTEVRRGIPAREIAAYITDTGIDLVCMEGALLPVGKIEAKACAARAFGAAELIVSEGSPSDVTVRGIRVVEVASIRDALDRVL